MTESTVGRGATTVGGADNLSATSVMPGLVVGALASIGAGAVHAAAAGAHSEQPGLARIFVICAAAQIIAGAAAVVRPTRLAASVMLAVNAVAVGGWMLTRLTGIGWIDGLQVREAPQFADSACAALGGVAAACAAVALLVGAQQRVVRRPSRLSVLPTLAVAALAVPAMVMGGTHAHSHDANADATHDHATVADGAGTGDVAIDESQPHDHGDGGAAETPSADPADPTPTFDENQPHDHGGVAPEPGPVQWPRPWDPSQPIDLSGVPGVSGEQQARATQLVADTLRDLPKYADPATAVADGYASIGDAGTGTEHYIKAGLIDDDDMLDPAAPESLVYRVDGESRILAGAMYIVSARPLDDPSLTAYAGPLMTWHEHNNLCWGLDDGGKPKVVGLTQADGSCAKGVSAGGNNPMVHVWIVPHECGVFAALEGVGAGNAAVPADQRVDTCIPGDHTHGDHTDPSATTVSAEVRSSPYDPALPIDLGGVPGVTAQQQAAAENLVAINVVRLPEWADYRTAEAAGFHSIGDGATGHEHFINWAWIDDDVVLDPDHPESLVYVPQPDGSKRLVGAMYMLPSSVRLTDVPDIGGALMQWHIHDNLCFTDDPVAPVVAGITSSDGTCRDGLTKLRPAPMIHVWIVPNKCGPFAALEGIGAGQVADGDAHLCDHVHGDGLL